MKIVYYLGQANVLTPDIDITRALIAAAAALLIGVVIFAKRHIKSEKKQAKDER